MLYIMLHINGIMLHIMANHVNDNAMLFPLVTATVDSLKPVSVCKLSLIAPNSNVKNVQSITTFPIFFI